MTTNVRENIIVRIRSVDKENRTVYIDYKTNMMSALLENGQFRLRFVIDFCLRNQEETHHLDAIFDMLEWHMELTLKERICYYQLLGDK